MLESLRLKGAPAFGLEVGVTVGPLTPVTFIFGPNGSGKTTISRAFANPARFPDTELKWAPLTGTHTIKVYNRDYVAETLKQAANLPGVFLLGKTSGEIQAEIDELTGSSGSIVGVRKQLKHLRGSLSEKQLDLAAVREALREAAWSKRSEVPSTLQEMFVGFNNSKENLLTRLLQVVDTKGSAVDDFDALDTEAEAVLAEDAVHLLELSGGQHIRLEDIPGFELLAIPIVGSGDVGLAPLIQQLQNADWVEHGRHYLGDAGDLCPFCQQTVPENLAKQLNDYFDIRYTHQIGQLKGFQHHIQTWVGRWRTYISDVLTNGGATDHLNAERFQAARLQLEQAMEQLTSTLATKLSGPSAIVDVVYPAAEIDAVNTIVEEANTSIRAFNLRLQNRATEKKALLERCWTSFARQTLATEVGHFEGAMPGLDKGKEKLSARIKSEEDLLEKKESRLRELQTQVTSSKPIIETINRLLDSVGFHSFRLKESTAVQDGYSLVRESGEIAADTLSEGEQTFITFLYFAQSLQGTPQESGELNDLVAVIDDPISSLDSDVLYVVSTLVRRIVADIADGKGRVRQLVLLTHNAHFHKEVTYKAQSDKHGTWRYGVVRKRNGQPSEIVLGADNPIQTAYAALWEEIKRSSQEPSVSTGSLQNILRRILETYFKVLGGVDTAAIIEKFDGADRVICRGLFSWVNAGSHSIFDDIDYSPTATTVEANLRVFRRIFEEQNQKGHYLMMMGESAGSPVMAGETPTSAELVERDLPQVTILAGAF
ncbi:AAA family ATPase [Arthrobacter sp. KK5.5]|uniref:AAA family ATPase n=1 Tax=Arthrobacter sp. KK5.5 TaxID=3373084 RepID=UPI003EE499DC